VLALGVLFFFVVSAVYTAVNAIAANSSVYFSAASNTLKQWTESLRQFVPPEMRGQMDAYIQQMADTLFTYVNNSIVNRLDALPSIPGLIVGLASAPFLVFYVLKDREKLSGFHTGLPDWARPHVRNILLIVEETFGQYIRATLMLGFVVGALTLVGLLLLRVPLALFLAILAGVMEMVPIVGPWISGITAVLVTLGLAPDKIIWVVLLFLSVQLLENVLLVPRIQSAYLRIHPAVAIVLLAIGVYIAGVWGLILTLPLTATVIGIYRYCCQVEQDEQESVAKPASPQDSKTQ
jgi:predicted PurR-regulated permease PerM